MRVGPRYPPHARCGDGARAHVGGDGDRTRVTHEPTTPAPATSTWRIVDGALMLTVAVVLVATLWTLVVEVVPSTSHGSRAVTSVTRSDGTTPASDAPTTPSLDVVPVDPNLVVDEGRGEDPVPSDDPVNRGVPASDGVTASTEVVLDRIGFSYVTGGSGACEVTLDAWLHVAVSRELLRDLGCGARVRIEFDAPVAGRRAVEAIVADTMNASFERTVNVYVAQDEPASEYGLATGRLVH